MKFCPLLWAMKLSNSDEFSLKLTKYTSFCSVSLMSHCHLNPFSYWMLYVAVVVVVKHEVSAGCGTCNMSVHQQRVGRRRITTWRRIATATDASVPVMRMMWTGQIDEARRRSWTGGRTRLAAERLSRCEAAWTAQQAVRMSRLSVAATVRRPALVQQVVENSPNVVERHCSYLPSTFRLSTSRQ